MAEADLTFVNRLRDLYFEAKHRGGETRPRHRIFRDLNMVD